ncbi:MAG TPA: hypothetical protein VIE63_13425 [Ramlibacter sp.]|jgi:hypothetical protein
MGFFMKEHDIYVGSMLDDLNLRFAPPQGGKEHSGGIDEMVELQKEFQIFKDGRPFATSVTSLHIGGGANHEAKNRFYAYLKYLRRETSNVKGKDGDAAIVAALIKDLAAKKPLPVYFSNHDLRESAGVIIKDKARPLFYMDQDYLWISFPSAPRSADGAAKKAAKKKK